MRKTVLSLAVVSFVLLSMFELHAATLAGVTLPDTAQIGGKNLVLNGWDCEPRSWSRSTSQGSTLSRSQRIPTRSPSPTHPGRSS